MDQLVSQCLKSESHVLTKSSKDAHMNSIGTDHVIVSMNQNVLVFDKVTSKKVKELNISRKEMSTSLVFGQKLLIGTFVDTIFLFDIAKNYDMLHVLPVQDSVLSLCWYEENVICCG